MFFFSFFFFSINALTSLLFEPTLFQLLRLSPRTSSRIRARRNSSPGIDSGLATAAGGGCCGGGGGISPGPGSRGKARPEQKFHSRGVGDNGAGRRRKNNEGRERERERAI